MMLAAATGVLLTGAFPRVQLFWLAWIALVPLLYGLQRAAGPQAFGIGYIAGLVHYLTLLYWVVPTIVDYGGLPGYLALTILMLLAGYLALFPAAFAGILAAGRLPPALLPVAVPAVWTALEFIRSVLFTGFPWALLGYSQYRWTKAIQISDLFGVWGLSGWIAGVNGIVLLGLLSLGRRTWQGRRVSRRTAFAALLAGGTGRRCGVWLRKLAHGSASPGSQRG